MRFDTNIEGQSDLVVFIWKMTSLAKLTMSRRLEAGVFRLKNPFLYRSVMRCGCPDFYL